MRCLRVPFSAARQRSETKPTGFGGQAWGARRVVRVAKAERVAYSIDKWAGCKFPLVAAEKPDAYVLELKAVARADAWSGRAVVLKELPGRAAACSELELRVREFNAGVEEVWRDNHDQSKYTGEYATKPLTTIEAPMGRMEIGVGRLERALRAAA